MKNAYIGTDTNTNPIIGGSLFEIQKFSQMLCALFFHARSHVY